MDVREKLIEILRKPIFPHELVDPTEAVADYLLKNGVTFAEWIPASERLPKYHTKVLCFAKGRIMDRMFVGNFAKNLRSVDPYLFKGEEYERPGFYYFDTEYEWVEETCVTHWMQLPEQPDGGSDLEEIVDNLIDRAKHDSRDFEVLQAALGQKPVDKVQATQTVVDMSAFSTDEIKEMLDEEV